jgi:hypothetical protein
MDATLDSPDGAIGSRIAYQLEAENFTSFEPNYGGAVCQREDRACDHRRTMLSLSKGSDCGDEHTGRSDKAPKCLVVFSRQRGVEAPLAGDWAAIMSHFCEAAMKQMSEAERELMGLLRNDSKMEFTVTITLKGGLWYVGLHAPGLCRQRCDGDGRTFEAAWKDLRPSWM